MIPYLLSPENTLIQHAVVFILSLCCTLAVKATAQRGRNCILTENYSHTDRYGQSNQRINTLYWEAGRNFLKVVLYQ